MVISLFDLFAQNIPDLYKDKVFWFAHHINITNTDINIHLDSKDCLVAFDDIAEILNIRSLSELSKPNSLNNVLHNKQPVLVSSGSFFFINNKLLVTQRNAKTKYDPLHWTSPAGRCDNLPYKTALKETAEEIYVFSKQSHRLLMPTLVSPYVNRHDVEFYDATYKFPQKFSFKNIYLINTWVDNELYESRKMCFFYNPIVNTIELRTPINIVVNEEIYFINPEFSTDVKLLTLEELRELKLVPMLKELILGE